MKITYPKLTFSLIALLTITTFGAFQNTPDKISISESESDETYEITASYGLEKIQQVHNFLNESFAPTPVFNSVNDYFEKTFTFENKMRLYIKTNPGKLLLILNKQENSEESLEWMKNLYTGLEETLLQR
ncbi:MAG: hypothetical protein WAR77_04935 [Saprospiraceae bacterium]|nr:hypothetical protein [Saprospiraceae bacterium]MBK8448597.1 hypothetical protein [Saprospiraceae bacterium]MBK9726644.1 hypothetical protein [Saprospiraceae bacterium]